MICGRSISWLLPGVEEVVLGGNKSRVKTSICFVPCHQQFLFCYIRYIYLISESLFPVSDDQKLLVPCASQAATGLVLCSTPPPSFRAVSCLRHSNPASSRLLDVHNWNHMAVPNHCRMPNVGGPEKERKTTKKLCKEVYNGQSHWKNSVKFIYQYLDKSQCRVMLFFMFFFEAKWRQVNNKACLVPAKAMRQTGPTRMTGRVDTKKDQLVQSWEIVAQPPFQEAVECW